MLVLAHRRLAVVLLAVGMLAWGLAPAASASHSWNGYHWARTTNSFTLLVGDNLDATWQSYLDTSITDWSQSSIVDLSETAGGTRPRQCKTTDGRVEVCNDSYGFNGWLGVAGISIVGKHIQAGYVKVNDSYFSSPTYNTPAWRNLVMCQEIGHTLGLGHTDENFGNAPEGTCMDYSSDPVPNQHPNQHDYEMLESIYNHLDSSNSYDDGTSTGGDDGGGGGNGGGPPDGKGPKNRSSDASLWGREVASDGHTSTFVRRDGETLWVTHVIWATGF